MKPKPENQKLFTRPSDDPSDPRWMVDQYDGKNRWASTIPCGSKSAARRKVNNIRAVLKYQEKENLTKEPS